MKPGYKRTELGLIPSNWQVLKVSAAGQVLGGRQRSPSASGAQTKYLRVANVFDGRIDIDDVLEMPFTPQEQERFRLVSGDILLNEGQSLELVGRSAIYQGIPADCCFQNTLIRFRAHKGTVPAFAQLVFQQYLRLGVFASIASQTTSIAHLGAGRFAALLMPLPPLPEQRAIAAALSDVDALLASLDRLIAKQRDLKQAAMQQLLTGEKRLPGFSGKWEKVRLGSVMQVCHGRSQREIEAASGAYPILASGGEIGRTNRWLHDRPSVLIGRKGTIDKPQYIDTPFWTVDTLFYTDISAAASARFLYYLFTTIQWRSYNEASGVPSLNASSIESIEFNCPKLTEQSAIATVLSDMDAEITALEHRRGKTRALKQGMMQELLTGRTRLV